MKITEFDPKEDDETKIGWRFLLGIRLFYLGLVSGAIWIWGWKGLWGALAAAIAMIVHWFLIEKEDRLPGGFLNPTGPDQEIDEQKSPEIQPKKE
jgi:hypothetical protein